MQSGTIRLDIPRPRRPSTRPCAGREAPSTAWRWSTATTAAPSCVRWSAGYTPATPG